VNPSDSNIFIIRNTHLFSVILTLHINMAVLLAWLICPILFRISFLIQTSYFIYKLMTSQSVGYSGNPTVRTISFTSCEVTCCMGWIWNTCLDKITNRMLLSTFIIWYIIGIFMELFITALFFLLFFYKYPVYV